MALPAQYSLMYSEYNVFLEALIGNGGNGMPISVISAFARLGLDPWREAERLSALPRDRAVSELNSLISGVQGGAWLPADTLAIAGRLTSLLPRQLRRMQLFAGKETGNESAPELADGTPDSSAGSSTTSRLRVPASDNQSGKAGSATGEAARRRRSRWLTVAIIVLVIAAGAAWFDQRFNHDRSLVPEESIGVSESEALAARPKAPGASNML